MKDQMMVLKQLDQQFAHAKPIDFILSPYSGWVRTLHKALGLTIKH